jgi:hypothetical protein
VLPGNYTIEVSLAGYDTGTIAAFEVSGDVTGKALALTKTVYTVSGTISVSDSGTGGSPEGAQVQLKQGASAVGSAVSASNGTYTINSVLPGTYTIEVSLAGYDTGTIAAFEVSGDVTGKDLALTKTVYTVSGTISVSDSGSPEGAQVQLKQGASAVGSAVSASNGTYTISGVLPGTYTIDVSLAGYDTGTISSFTVSSANVTDKDITLTKIITGYTVQGQIFTKAGEPAAGASVKLREAGAGELAETTADSSGCYSINTPTAAAEYYIRAKGIGISYPTDSAYFTLTLGVPKTVNVTQKY